MSEFVKTPIRVSHRIEAEKFVDTYMQVENIPAFDRAMSATGALVVCWFLAIVFIAIPVLHFFLVPLAALAGVVAFVVRLRLHKRRQATEFKCPNCGERLVAKAGSFNFPMRESCSNCRSILVIDQRDPSAS
jgi:predicted RNA-binding Zn-ribbon protein involved in translation (DUF1610 family)